MSINPSWRRTNVSGNHQSFHVRVPITYKLPSFSPNWSDYVHDADNNNETVVLTDDANTTGIKVYSAAQLQLLWQSFFIKCLEEDQSSSYTNIRGYKFKVVSNTYNTVLFTYPKMDHIPSDYIPDLANLSGYWITKEDRSIVVRPLCELYQEGSYDDEGNLKTELPADAAFLAYAAAAYGIKGSDLSAIKSMGDILKVLKAYNRIEDEEYVMNNVTFPPATIVSPEWWQMPLSGYAAGRSPLSVLTSVCEKFSVHDLHLNVTNAGTSSYGNQIKMGIFKSSTIPVTTSMNNIANTGAYNVQVLAAAGDHFDLYTQKGKTISCAPVTNEYALYPAPESWGFNLVVKAEIEWSNFFRQGKTSFISNSSLIVWTGEVNYDVDCVCLVPFLLDAAFNKRLGDLYLLQLVEGEGSGGDTPGPDPPTPTPTVYAGAIPSTALLSILGSNKLAKHVAKLASVKMLKGVKQPRTLKDNDTVNDLYPQLDPSIIGAISNPGFYPMQQGLSLEGLKGGEEGKPPIPYTINQSVEVNSYKPDPSEPGEEPALQPVNEEDNKPIIENADFSSPMCAPGMNCYGRRGACLRANNFNGETLISEWKVKANVSAGSKVGITVSMDEMFMANTVQANQANLENIVSALEETGETVVYGAQANGSDPDAPDTDVDSQGTEVEPEENGVFVSKFLAPLFEKIISEDGTLYKSICKSRGVQQNVSVTQPIMSITPKTGRRRANPVSFMGAEVVIPQDFKPYKDPVPNTVEAWPADVRDMINYTHKGILSIPYVLQVDEDEDLAQYTPGQYAISKSQVTNFNASLGTTHARDNTTLPEDFRTDQSPTDFYSCQTINRCLAVLSSIPFGQPGFDKVACICSAMNSFISAPAPATLAQISAANGSAAASIYGSCTTEGGKTYVLFNNTIITTVNDLSGTLQFMIPAKIPVLEEGEVVMKDMKEYIEAGNRVYTSVYNLTDISVDAKLGSGVSKLADDHQMCLMLWNYARQPGEIPVSDFSMPQIPIGGGWNKGRINLLANNQTGRLTVLTRYFYMVTDKENVNQCSTPADAETPVEKRKKRLGKKKGTMNSYQIQKMLERKLPMGLGVRLIGC